MSLRLKRNIHFLKVLQKSKPNQIKAIVANSNKDLLLCICEVIDNILRGTVRLKPKQRTQLLKYKKVLRQLTNKKVKLPAKRKIILNQAGGFLPAILVPALSIAASLLGGLV